MDGGLIHFSYRATTSGDNIIFSSFRSYIILTVRKLKTFTVFSPNGAKAFITYGLLHFKIKNENLIENDVITA